MRPLLLSGFGTSLRVNGRTLEIDWRSEGRKETYRPQQLPFDSVVVDSLTGSVSFEALRFLAIHAVPVTLLCWNGTVLSTILPRGPSNGELRVAQVEAYGAPDRRLKIAREFTREKVAKTVALTENFSKTLPVNPDPIHKEAESDQGTALNDLRVYEARASVSSLAAPTRPESVWLARPPAPTDLRIPRLWGSAISATLRGPVGARPCAAVDRCEERSGLRTVARSAERLQVRVLQRGSTACDLDDVIDLEFARPTA